MGVNAAKGNLPCGKGAIIRFFALQRNIGNCPIRGEGRDEKLFRNNDLQSSHPRRIESKNSAFNFFCLTLSTRNSVVSSSSILSSNSYPLLTASSGGVFRATRR
jgi:hypothetical protein